MGETLYAVFQCKENNYIETVESIKTSFTDDIIVYVDEKENKDLDYKYVTMSDKTLAHYKNNAIKYAKEHQYKYVFLIENDVVITDNAIFGKYIDLMEEYNLATVFYGFYGSLNTCMNDIPNPALNVTISESVTQTFIRMPVDAFVGINIQINTQEFNETFNIMEYNEFLKRCHDYKILPFSGFYFEVYESWKYFSYCKNGILPKKITQEMLKADKKYVSDNGDKFILNMTSNVNEVLDYLKGR